MSQFRLRISLSALAILTTLVPLTARANLVLIQDDFSAASLTNGGLVRDSVGWKKGSPQTWAIVGGQLTNAGGSTHSNDTQRQRENEGAVGQIVDVSTIAGLGAADFLTVSFDYTMADPGESLYVHLWGYVENATASTPTTSTMNLGASNGNAWESSGATFDQYNLGKPDGVFTGTSGAGSDAAAIVTGGSGSFSTTFDLSAFATAPNTVAGYDYIVLGFARNEPGDGSTSALTLDNIFLTSVPEPSSISLLGIAGILLGVHRRRRIRSA